MDTARLHREGFGRLPHDGGHDKAGSGTERPRENTGVIHEYLRANPKVFLKFKKRQLIFKELKKNLLFFLLKKLSIIISLLFYSRNKRIKNSSPLVFSPRALTFQNVVITSIRIKKKKKKKMAVFIFGLFEGKWVL